MKLGIMQPYFMPYIGYWQLMNTVDKYVIYDDVNFIKSGWIHRNRILVNGGPAYLSIPLVKASQNKHINQISVNYGDKIFEKGIKTLENAYRKAPQFDTIFPILENIYDNRADTVVGFIQNSFQQICEYLNIQTELILSSDIKKDNELRGEDKILHICSLLGADEYYNAVGGQELYHFERFTEQNIKLGFLKTERVEYQQFADPFQPNLSIIDVLMFNSKQDVKNMLNQYTLITKYSSED